MIFRKISFWIVEAVYPLIPSLYNIFQILAENRFFTQEQISALSNNIYIFISVCMLFAFGIRLLNGIVNPELLGEKKKGVRSVFFNAFAAVILIIIIPLGFRVMYSIQDRVMESHLIEKIFLGTELTEDQNPGQIIAAYAFSAFCYPAETVKSSGLDSNGEDLYNKALSEDISYVKKLTGYINDGKGLGKNREYDLEYNSILAPAAGIVVMYELVLMCMDLALRSVKLGLLQLIAPIILCGFIFKGTDLLQKWFKEVITTWVLLFLKVAMVVFMIYGLALLPGFLDTIDFPDSSGRITKGLVKMFILIGLLQVIKQLPNIINSVFGTNIQSRGGIKGRLGEMAGVGQIAQQAWSGLGNKAKAAGIGAAKLGALAYTGVKGIAGAVGLAAGGAAVNKWWNKGIGNHGPAKDTKFGKGVRTAGAGVKAVGKGLGKKGGLFASISEGAKAFNETDIGKQIGAERLQQKQTKRSGAFRNNIEDIAKKQFGLPQYVLNSDRSIKRDSNGNPIKNTIFDENGNVRKENAMIAQKAIAAAIDNDKSLSSTQKKAMKSYYKSQADEATMKEIKSQKDKMTNEVQRSMDSLDKSSPDYQEKYDKLEKLKDKILNGGESVNQIDSRIRELVESKIITEEAGNNMGTSMRKILNAFSQADLSDELKGKYLEFDAAGKVKLDGQFNLNNGMLLGDLSNMATTVAKNKSDYDDLKNSLSDTGKEVVSRYETNANDANERAVFDQQTTKRNGQSESYEFKYSTVPLPGDQEFIGPLPAGGTGGTPAPSGESGSTTDSSSTEARPAGEYQPGVYAPTGQPATITGDVNANVDLSSLEQGLAALNQTIDAGNKNVAQAVNNQGGEIANKINDSNVKLKNIDKNIGSIKDSVDKLGPEE